MTSRSFRRLFPQLNVRSIGEDEFYRQARRSQLLTGPDERELASFRPDVRDPLELVEATPELAGMLGSSLEFVHSRWDSLEASPPPTPPAGQRFPPLLPPEARSAESGLIKNLGCSETNMNARTWEHPGSRNTAVPLPAKPNVTATASMWEPQRQQSKNAWIPNSANSDSKMDSREQQQGAKSEAAVCANTWEPQRQGSRSPDTKVDPQNPANPATGAADANAWKRPNQGRPTGGVSDSTNRGPSVDAAVCETQRLRSKTAGITSPVSVPATDANAWERQGVKRAGGTTTTSSTDAHGGKTVKMDAAWQRNLGNLRVHIRDLGLKVGGGTIQRDTKKDPGKAAGKGVRVKSRS